MTYSQRQLDILESVFRQTKYPDYDVRVELERQVELSQMRILVWFKNRRVRHRQEEGPVEVNTKVKRKPKGSTTSPGIHALETSMQVQQCSPEISGLEASPDMLSPAGSSYVRQDDRSIVHHDDYVQTNSPAELYQEYPYQMPQHQSSLVQSQTSASVDMGILMNNSSSSELLSYSHQDLVKFLTEVALDSARDLGLDTHNWSEQCAMGEDMITTHACSSLQSLSNVHCSGANLPYVISEDKSISPKSWYGSTPQHISQQCSDFHIPLLHC